MIEFLAFAEGTPKEAAGAYRAAFEEGAGATRYERDSMLQQLEVLEEFLKGEVRDRAKDVRHALTEPA
ncbi:MAG: hypothetical protein OES69_08635 [Myxococcales bacterium]|nr:hypothetical protein [Myxococcales bacterium]